VKNFLRLTLVVSVALVIWAVFRTPEAPRANPVKDTKDRHHAPEFTLKDVSGKVVRLSDFRGKVVLLDFWATWCGPCGIEIPWFVEFQRKFKDRGFEVLGVSMDDDGWKAVSPFVAEKKINYRIVLGDSSTSDLYGGVEALPTTFVIDREGRIASTHVGLTSRRDFEDAIEKLLDTPAASIGSGNRPQRPDEPQSGDRAVAHRQSS
jgi:cytochrome c biogenesis protein CcmG/thiol:disulfide interchange protein DsbE